MQDQSITRQRSKVQGFALYVPPSARRGVTNEVQNQQDTDSRSNKTVKQVCIEIPGQKSLERRGINTETELQDTGTFSPSKGEKTKNDRNDRSSNKDVIFKEPEMFKEIKPVLPQPKVREVFKGAYVPPGRRALNVETPTPVIKSNSSTEKKASKQEKNPTESIPDDTDGPTPVTHSNSLTEIKASKLEKNSVASIPDDTNGNTDAAIDIKGLEISNMVDREVKKVVTKTSSDAPRGSYVPPWQRAAIAEEKRSI
jgi:hypothetical protein